VEDVALENPDLFGGDMLGFEDVEVSGKIESNRTIISVS